MMRCQHIYTTTVLRPFFRDQPDEPVPEENFWTLRCKGRLPEADTPTIRLGATPTGLTTNQCQPPPGTADSPICVCGKDNETVHHVLLHCSRYSDAIAQLHDTVEGVYDFAKSGHSVTDRVNFIIAAPYYSKVYTEGVLSHFNVFVSATDGQDFTEVILY